MPQKRILLVDDYPDALEIWGLYLRSLGYDVDTAEDGLSAVADAHRLHPDIIVLDFRCDGEIMARLKAEPATARIPVIALTELGPDAKE